MLKNRFMTRKKTFKALAVTISLGLISLTTYKLTFTKNQLILDILMSGLNNAHYAPLTVNDDFSRKVYDLYLERIDYNKKFLLQSDVDAMNQYREKIDDEITKGSFDLFNLSAF